MATPRFAWGIDIGNRALKAVKLVSSAEGFRVDDFEVIEHETVLSAAGDNRESLIQTALANFVQRHPGIEKGQVGVGVSGQQSFARFIKLPPVEPKKIPEIVRFEAIQQIPFPLDDVEWSYQLFQDPESPEVEVGIFAMRKELINQHIKYFTSIDLNVQVVQMNPLAVYNAMYYDSRIKGTTMIVDLGAENTDLIIAEGETIWLRSIPIGGNNFTEALTKAFKVNFAKAEDLKRNATTSKYGRQIMQAMRPIFADLVSEIQRSIGFYASVHRDSRIAKIIALGSTFRLPGLQKYLQQNLQLEVEKINGLSAGAPTDPKMAVTFDENLLSITGAYGLALQVMGQGKITSSLLPEVIRREKMWREKTKWFAGAAALFLLGTAVPYGAYYYNNWQMDQTASQQDYINRIKTKATALDSSWSNIEQSGASDRTRISNVDSLLTYRDLWPKLTTDIYKALPQMSPNAPQNLQAANPAVIKQTPRNARQQIIIEKMISQYAADLTNVIDSTKTDDPSFRKLARDTSGGDLEVPSGGGGMPGGDMGGMGGMGSMGGMPGMGPMGGMGMPGMGDTGGGGSPDLATTGAVTAATPRGFLITVKCVTPNSAGFNLVDSTFVKNLMAIQPVPDAPGTQYVVKRAAIVSALQLSNDPTRMSKMVADWRIKKAAKDAKDAADAAAAAAANNTNPGNPNGGSDMPGMPGGMPGANMMPPGGMAPGGLGGMQAPGVASNSTVIPPEAYFDPVLGEDVRGDTECIVLFAVQVDPPPPPAPAPGAPAAPGRPVAVVPVTAP